MLIANEKVNCTRKGELYKQRLLYKEINIV